jgi:hypothetical protein
MTPPVTTSSARDDQRHLRTRRCSSRTICALEGRALQRTGSFNRAALNKMSTLGDDEDVAA